jgi:hypothetical protein
VEEERALMVMCLLLGDEHRGGMTVMWKILMMVMCLPPGDEHQGGMIVT